MKERIHYEERTGWPWWVHGLISLCFLALIAPIREFLRGTLDTGPHAMSVPVAILCVALGLGLPALIYTLFGQLRVRVMEERLEVAWGLSEWIRKTLYFRDIQKAEAITYSPLGEFGGWGIRMGMGKRRAWTIRGNRALLLHLTDGTRFYLGSRHPERLLLRVEAAGRGKMADETDGDGRDEP
jgi:hypothetical protein